MSMRWRTYLLTGFILGAVVALTSDALLVHELGPASRLTALAIALGIGVGLSAWVARRVERAADVWNRGVGEKENPPESGVVEMDQMLLAASSRIEHLRKASQVAEERIADLSAVFAAMREGVIVLDSDGRVLDVNDAARAMLDLGDLPMRGRLALEVVRNAELNRLVQRILRTREHIESELTAFGSEARSLQVRLSPLALSGGAGRRFGVLLVVHDVSRLRALERVRRDFAANASHELRTPVTAIRGFAESLRDLPLPEEAARFAEAIARNALQLQALIQDLLTLAEIESDQEQGRTPKKENLLVDVLFAAVEEACGPAARSKRIRLAFSTPEGLRVPAVPGLLERALVNLVENAIRYSDSGTRVDIIAETTEQDVVFHVRDQGVGIAPEHLERIFERFYRVDRARSRRQGGTGLGLSIVRHAVESQGGTVSATSVLGQGSTFTVRLPRE